VREVRRTYAGADGVTNICLDAVHVRRRAVGQLDRLQRRYDMGVVFSYSVDLILNGHGVVGQKFMPG